MSYIAILCFGSQYTHLISKKYAAMGITTRIVPHDTPLADIADAAGIILSGSPHSINTAKINFDYAILDTYTKPTLSICFGFHLLAKHYGCVIGRSEGASRGYYGRHHIQFIDEEAHDGFNMLVAADGLLDKGDPAPTKSLNNGEQVEHPVIRTPQVWMSCGDVIQKVSDQVHVVATLVEDPAIPTIIHVNGTEHAGLQFHPEVIDTEYGYIYLAGFALQCGLKPVLGKGDTPNETSEFLKNRYNSIIRDIQQQVRDKCANDSFRIISFISGGVDSTVSTLLCERAFPGHVVPVYVDTGLMRKAETEQVARDLPALFPTLQCLDRSALFLDALAGVTDGEQKRRIIGQLFVDIFIDFVRSYESQFSTIFLAQGTLYTDLIESGAGCGNQAQVIKSHHNVKNPILEEKRAAGLLIEPNSTLYKDDVRAIGEYMGINRDFLWRHPFPGPGLAIRITGAITPERLAILREADAKYLSMLKEAVETNSLHRGSSPGIYGDIWQAFATLITEPVVGVMGDERVVGYIVGLRAVKSVDGMTATPYPIPHQLLADMSTELTKIRGVTRVMYDYTSKPAGTIELV